MEKCRPGRVEMEGLDFLTGQEKGRPLAQSSEGPHLPLPSLALGESPLGVVPFAKIDQIGF